MATWRLQLDQKWGEIIKPWLGQPVAGKLTAGWVMVIFILAAIIAVVPFWVIQNPDLDQIVSDIFVPTYSLAATVVLLFAGWNTLPNNRQAGIAWLIIGLAVFLNSLGEIFWSYFSWSGQDPFPSLADVFYLLSYPTLLIGILTLPFQRRSGLERITKFLEICIISISASLILWNYLIGPMINFSEEQSVLELIFTLAYPAFDMLLLLALQALFFRKSEAVRLRPLVFLSLGIVAWIFSDITFTLQELGGGYQVGGIADTGYMLASICYALAGVCQYYTQHNLTFVETTATIRVRTTINKMTPFIRSYLSPAMLLVIYHMLVISTADQTTLSYSTLLIWLGILLVLVSIVQILYTHDNVQLNLRLQKTNTELERRVAERTHTLANMTDALRASEERYRAVVEDSPVLVCTYSKGGILTFVNQPLAAYFNKTPAELIGQCFFDLVLPQDRQVIEEKINELSIANPVMVQEHRAMTSNGELRWQRWVYRLVVDGLNIKYQAIGEDITEQRLGAEQLRQSEERFRILFETMAQGVVYQDAHGKIISANPAAQNILGLSLDQMLGRQSIDPRWKAIHEDGSDFPGDEHPSMLALRSGEEVNNVVMGVFNPRDDSHKWINIHAVPQYLPGESQPYRVYATFEDITERKKHEQDLGKVNMQLRRGIEELSLVTHLDELLQLCQVDREAFQAIGSVIDRIFPNESGVMTVAHSDGAYQVQVEWGKSDHSKVIFPNQCLALRRGRPYFVEDTQRGFICEHMHPQGAASSICVPMIAQNEIYGSLHVEKDLRIGVLDEPQQNLATMVANSIALALSNIRLRETLRDQAIRDPLTGLFNRRFMEESLQRELLRSDRNGQPLGVLMLDIDHFKHFNDRYGHDAGDLLLSEAAKIMSDRIRASDITCRYGGEEFIIVLPDSSQEIALDCAERIRFEISQLRLNYQDRQLEPVTVSVGVAIYPHHAQTADNLLRQADIALYIAKDAGRNTVALASA